jgi:hypothetical protein
MKKITVLAIIALGFTAGLTAACSSDTTPPNNTTANGGNRAANATNAANTDAAHKTDEEIPASVKSAFPDAQTFTKQHKDIPASAVASIEKDTGGKVPDKDFHSYLAFATRDGKRTQLGAATVVKANGKDVIIIYESKNGMPTIREVRVESVSKEFLKQFAGKNHDAKIKFGEDIKANGADESAAKAITEAVRIDVLTMEALYGTAHSH